MSLLLTTSAVSGRHLRKRDRIVPRPGRGRGSSRSIGPGRTRQSPETRSSAWVKTPSDTQAVAQVESWRWMSAPGQNDSARPCRLQNSSVRPQGEAIRTRLAAASTRGPSVADRGRSDSQFAAVAKRVRAESVDPQTPFVLRLDERRCSPAHPPTDPGRAVLGGRSPGRGASRRYRCAPNDAPEPPRCASEYEHRTAFSRRPPRRDSYCDGEQEGRRKRASTSSGVTCRPVLSPSDSEERRRSASDASTPHAHHPAALRPMRPHQPRRRQATRPHQEEAMRVLERQLSNVVYRQMT